MVDRDGRDESHVGPEQVGGHHRGGEHHESRGTQHAAAVHVPVRPLPVTAHRGGKDEDARPGVSPDLQGHLPPERRARPLAHALERHRQSGHADDERNFVKKAVNWSLRQIGKRSLHLNRLAIETAEKIKLRGTKPARWIAADALRELTSEKVKQRLEQKLQGKGDEP